MKLFKNVSTIFLAFCVAGCQLSQKHKIADLLIDLSVFPSGWVMSEEGPGKIASAPLGGNKSVESIELQFYAYGGGAIESIRRYESIGDAEVKYEQQKKRIFRQTEFTSSWEAPKELEIDNLHADQFFYACAKSVGSPVPTCNFIGQYELYFVDFSSGIDIGYMNYQDFARIIHAIDDRMGKQDKTK